MTEEKGGIAVENAGREELSGQKRYLSPFSAWSLSFGCAVGWGCFVMPGTTFLPSAGPMGTVLGMLLGAVVMVLIGLNYHYLMNRYPGSGGALNFTIKAFGYDHGFLSAWFLILVYMAITWANASAVALIARQLFGSFFSFGFHYQLLGYDVYGGEALLSLVVIILAALICIRGRSLARMLQGVLASMLILGIVICFAMVFLKRGQGFGGYAPAFSPWAGNPLSQVLTIIVLSPWAYVGFESISQSASRLRFSLKKTIWVFATALAAGAAAYVLVSLIAASLQPPEYQSWADYVGDLGNLTGTKSLPVFYAVHELGGKLGMTVLGLTVLSAILTGIIGNSIAAGR
ncbi:MAG: APC family permease [Lachnospiraceae bacterium]|nr:APC family permease [Lachnospiraceae bacterium]